MSKLPRGFATYPPRAFPKRTCSFQKALNEKASLKILLYLNSEMASRRGRSLKRILGYCQIRFPKVQACILRLEAESLILKDQRFHRAGPTRYLVTRKGQKFLAHMMATSATADGPQAKLILVRCRQMLHQRNRPKKNRSEMFWVGQRLNQIAHSSPTLR